LRDVQPLGGPAEVQLVGDGDEERSARNSMVPTRDDSTISTAYRST
jgi:hypothetical protein